MTTTATRGSGKDDSASTEVIGYILSFAISAIILVISTQAFMRAQQNTDHVVNGVELRTVASRVATRLVEAGIVAQEFPNATVTIRMRVHEAIGDEPYRVKVEADRVVATMAHEGLNADSTTFKLDKVANIAVSGTAYSSNGAVIVTFQQTHFMKTSDYSMPHSGTFGGTPYLTKKITIKSG